MLVILEKKKKKKKRHSYTCSRLRVLYSVKTKTDWNV